MTTTNKNLETMTQELVIDTLSREIPGYTFSFGEINKSNESYTALSIRESGSPVGVLMREAVLIDEFPVTMERVVSNVKDFIKLQFEGKEDVKNLVMETGEHILDYEWAKSRLVLTPIGYGAGVDYFESVPHVTLAPGLSIMVRVLLDEKNFTSTQVTNALLDVWGIDKNTLFKDAKTNSPKLKPIKLEGFATPGADASPMKLLTTTSRDDTSKRSFYDRLMSGQSSPIYGAGAIAYPGAIESIYEKFKERVFVLPSSVHELILIPESEAPSKNYTENVEQLSGLVRMVNSDEVNPEDKLSDTVYVIDKDGIRVA